MNTPSIRLSIATRTVLGLALVGVLSTGSQAALIGGVTALETSSELSSRTGSDAVDGTGWAAGLHDGVADSMWLNTGAGCCGGNGTGPGGADLERSFGREAHIVIDLGAVYNVTDFTTWNYGEGGAGGNTRGIRDVVISISNTNNMLGTAAAIPTGGDISTLTTNQFAISNAAPDPGQNHVEAFQARYVRIDALTNWGDGLSLTGLAEIKFNGAPVPEPSSFALAALGLAGLGWFGVRRRKG